MTDTTLDRDIPRTDVAEYVNIPWFRTGYFAPGFHEFIEQELDRIESLSPNWDGQGAQPINKAIVHAARNVTKRIPCDLVKKPSIVPMSKGNLQFEWHEGERSLELEIEDPETIHYLKWHPDEGVEDEGLFCLDDTPRIINLIRWFTRSVADV